VTEVNKELDKYTWWSRDRCNFWNEIDEDVFKQELEKLLEEDEGENKEEKT